MERPTHPEALGVSGRARDRGRLVAAARQLFAQRGPSVTLSEVVLAAGVGHEDSACDPRSAALVDSVLAQRLGDLIDLVRVLHEPDAAGPPPPSGPDVGWVEAAREIVLAHLDRPALSLGAVARMLAVSPRTLQRRFAEEGTSWRAELDAARRERAAKLLDQGLTTDVTAERLGYSGSRALRRALRRWNTERADPANARVGGRAGLRCWNGAR